VTRVRQSNDGLLRWRYLFGCWILFDDPINLDFRGNELGHLQRLGGLAWHVPFGVAVLIPTKSWFAAGDTLV